MSPQSGQCQTIDPVEPQAGHITDIVSLQFVGRIVRAHIGRYKTVIGGALRSHTDEAQATEVAIAVLVLNRMLGLGRPESVRVA